jgi:hypothetical protein
VTFSIKTLALPLLFIAFLTTSFDLFLNVDIGFNFRFCQLVLGVLFILGIFKTIVQTRLKVVKPLGFEYLLAWSLFIIIFIPNNTFYTKSLGYAIWLIYNLLLVFFLVQLLADRETVLKAARLYLYSFFALAIIGLIQFLLPIVGLVQLLPTALLPSQWWIVGVLPRINGFSYEPSAYASYMTMGFIFSSSLKKYRTCLVSPRRLTIIQITIALAMFLTSSRMGWVVMGLWFLHYAVLFVVRLFRGKLNLRYSVYFGGFFVVVPALLVYAYQRFAAQLLLFASGTGLLGSSAHSYDQRSGELVDTLAVFLQSPLVGYSFGGLSTAVAQLNGIRVTTLEQASAYEPMGFFPVVLAASGLIGFVFFIMYLGSLLVKSILLQIQLSDQEMRIVLSSMIIALVFELVILQLTQNPLQIILWMHIALLTAVYQVAKKNTYA